MDKYERKTIHTYIDIERADYNRLLAIARLKNMSAAKLLGDLAKKYLTKNANELKALSDFCESDENKSL